MQPRELSIVIPVHNEEENIIPLTTRLMKVISTLGGYSTGIIFVNDGSSDKSAGIIEKLIGDGMPVTLVQLSRNFGHQAALEAGIASATGDIIITMDGDQQHPPEYIPQMIEAYEKGADVVQMKRTNATGDFKGFLSLMFYSLFNQVSDYPITANAADFRLISRRVRDEILKINVKGKFLRVLVPSVGFRQVYLEYTQEKRLLGKPSYTYYSSYLLAYHMLFKYTRVPHQALFGLGLFILAAGFFYLLYLVTGFLAGGIHSVGKSQIILAALIILSGSLLLGFAILASYLFFILEQLRSEPYYIISYIKKG